MPVADSLVKSCAAQTGHESFSSAHLTSIVLPDLPGCEQHDRAAGSVNACSAQLRPLSPHGDGDCLEAAVQGRQQVRGPAAETEGLFSCSHPQLWPPSICSAGAARQAAAEARLSHHTQSSGLNFCLSTSVIVTKHRLFHMAGSSQQS